MFPVVVDDKTVIITALYQKGIGGQVEISNPKQYPNLNVLNSKPRISHVSVADCFGNWLLDHWNLLDAWVL